MLSRFAQRIAGMKKKKKNATFIARKRVQHQQRG